MTTSAEQRGLQRHGQGPAEQEAPPPKEDGAVWRRSGR